MNEFETRHFDVTLEQDDNFSCFFSEDSEFDVDFGEQVPSGDYHGPYTVIPSSERQTLLTENKTLSQNVVVEAVTAYEGAYEVTPRLYSQGLDTDGKLMSDDVTVHEIPVIRTSNPDGGITVLIG